MKKKSIGAIAQVLKTKSQSPPLRRVAPRKATTEPTQAKATPETTGHEVCNGMEAEELGNLKDPRDSA